MGSHEGSVEILSNESPADAIAVSPPGGLVCEAIVGGNIRKSSAGGGFVMFKSPSSPSLCWPTRRSSAPHIQPYCSAPQGVSQPAPVMCVAAQVHPHPYYPVLSHKIENTTGGPSTGFVPSSGDALVDVLAAQSGHRYFSPPKPLGLVETIERQSEEHLMSCGIWNVVPHMHIHATAAKTTHLLPPSCCLPLQSPPPSPQQYISDTVRGCAVGPKPAASYDYSHEHSAAVIAALPDDEAEKLKTDGLRGCLPLTAASRSSDVILVSKEGNKLPVGEAPSHLEEDAAPSLPFSGSHRGGDDDLKSKCSSGQENEPSTGLMTNSELPRYHHVELLTGEDSELAGQLSMGFRVIARKYVDGEPDLLTGSDEAETLRGRREDGQSNVLHGTPGWHAKNATMNERDGADRIDNICGKKNEKKEEKFLGERLDKTNAGDDLGAVSAALNIPGFTSDEGQHGNSSNSSMVSEDSALGMKGCGEVKYGNHHTITGGGAHCVMPCSASHLHCFFAPPSPYWYAPSGMAPHFNTVALSASRPPKLEVHPYHDINASWVSARPPAPPTNNLEAADPSLYAFYRPPAPTQEGHHASSNSLVASRQRWGSVPAQMSFFDALPQPQRSPLNSPLMSTRVGEYLTSPPSRYYGPLDSSQCFSSAATTASTSPNLPQSKTLYPYSPANPTSDPESSPLDSLHFVEVQQKRPTVTLRHPCMSPVSLDVLKEGRDVVETGGGVGGKENEPWSGCWDRDVSPVPVFLGVKPGGRGHVVAGPDNAENATQVWPFEAWHATSSQYRCISTPTLTVRRRSSDSKVMATTRDRAAHLTPATPSPVASSFNNLEYPGEPSNASSLAATSTTTSSLVAPPPTVSAPNSTLLQTHLLKSPHLLTPITHQSQRRCRVYSDGACEPSTNEPSALPSLESNSLHPGLMGDGNQWRSELLMEMYGVHALPQEIGPVTGNFRNDKVTAPFHKIRRYRVTSDIPHSSPFPASPVLSPCAAGALVNPSFHTPIPSFTLAPAHSPPPPSLLPSPSLHPSTSLPPTLFHSHGSPLYFNTPLPASSPEWTPTYRVGAVNSSKFEPHRRLETPHDERVYCENTTEDGKTGSPLIKFRTNAAHIPGDWM